MRANCRDRTQEDDMLDRVRRFLARAADARAVAALSARDLADLGVSRDQAMNLVSLPDDVPGRIAAMGRIFGLTEAELMRDRGAWEELLMTCNACRELGACRRLLADADTATPTQAAFCPNSGRFALPA